MKTATVFTAIAAVVVVATSVGLGAQAQNEPQNRPAPAVSAPVAPAPAAAQVAAPASAAPAPAAPVGDASKTVDPKLTKEEFDQAETILGDKCTRCHGVEQFINLHQNRAEWQQVLNDMGPSADLSKDETALVLRYLVQNLGPVTQP